LARGGDEWLRLGLLHIVARARFLAVLALLAGCSRKAPLPATNPPAPAHLESSIMTAPVDEVGPPVLLADSVRWALSPDSCSMLVPGQATGAGRVVSELSDTTARDDRRGDAVSSDWIWRAAPVAAFNRRAPLVTPAGKHQFIVRNESIIVSGPDQAGRVTERVVGKGRPVAATANGEFLLAVRLGKQGAEAVVYRMTLDHALFQSTCHRSR